MDQIKCNQRLPWLDMAKAIAMIAVVFSHEFASVTPLVLLCNSFMLPLFFLCSGYCLSPGKYEMGGYIRRKIKSLLLPYVGLGLLVSLLHVFIDGYGEVVSKVIADLFSWQTLWFLPVLFVADIVLYFILTMWERGKINLLSIGFSFLILGMTFCKLGLSLPIKLEVVPIAVFYLTVGFAMKEMLMKDIFHHHTMMGALLLLVGIILVVMTRANLILISNDILPITKMLFSTMESVGIMLILSIIIPPTLQKYNRGLRLLAYIGRNTMVIFAFHMPIFFYCQELLRPLFNSQLYYKPLEFVLIWCISLLLIPFMNRYAPMLIGKNKKK